MKPFLGVVFVIFCLTTWSLHPVLADTHQSQADQYWGKALNFANNQQSLQAANMFAKSAEAEKKSSTPRWKGLTIALSNAGYYFYVANRYDKALIFDKEALALADKHQFKQLKATILSNMGLIYHLRSQYPEALNLYQQALAITRLIGLKSLEADVLNGIGLVYRFQGKHQKALGFYEKALKIDSGSGRKKNVAVALLNIGKIYDIWGQYDKALAHYQQALSIERALGDKRGIGSKLTNIANIYDNQGKYEKALKLYEEVLAINEKLDDLAGKANTLNNIAEVYRHQNQLDKAMAYFEKALAIDKQINLPFGKAVRLNNIAMVYQARHQYQKALNNFFQALAIIQELDNSDFHSSVLNNIGEIYRVWAQYDKAVEYLNRALIIDRKLGHQQGISRVLNNLGNVYRSWGQNDKAIEYYNQSEQLFKKLDNKLNRAVALNNIGQIYHQWSQLEKAIQYFRQALSLNEEIGNQSGIGDGLNHLGLVYHARGQYSKAIQHFKKALVIAKEQDNQLAIATRLNNMGSVYDMWGKYDDAQKHFFQALEKYRTLNYQPEIPTVLTNIGLMYIAQKKYKKAINYLNQSITVVEKVRLTAPDRARRDYLASQIHAYQYLISSFINAEDVVGAYQAMEQSKSRVLLEKLSHKTIDIPPIKTMSDRLSPHAVIVEYANVHHWWKMAQLTLTKERISVRENDGTVPLQQALAKYKQQMQLASKKAEQLVASRSLNRGVTLLTEKESELNESSQLLEALVYHFRELLTHPGKNISELRDIGNILYQVLIKPIEKPLKGKQELIIIPEGILSFLPFESLVDDNGKYLIETYDISYIQSISILNNIQNRNYGPRQSVLAFGGPIYEKLTYKNKLIERGNKLQLRSLINQIEDQPEQSMREKYGALYAPQWSNLPGTVTEVKGIQQAVQGAKVVMGAQVSEKHLKALSSTSMLEQYKVLHFATHGLVVSEIPELSALVLSQFHQQQGGEDGYLRMNEISKLKLKADFVNLSACETGLGKVYGGEGVVGLTQAFLIAGSNAVAVSLWKVNDLSTSEFMKAMYAKKGNYFKNMTEVKKEFLNGQFGKKYSHPYYWAPFVYYGK